MQELSGFGIYSVGNALTFAVRFSHNSTTKPSCTHNNVSRVTSSIDACRGLCPEAGEKVWLFTMMTLPRGEDFIE